MTYIGRKFEKREPTCPKMALFYPYDKYMEETLSGLCEVFIAHGVEMGGIRREYANNERSIPHQRMSS